MRWERGTSKTHLACRGWTAAVDHVARVGVELFEFATLCFVRRGNE